MRGHGRDYGWHYAGEDRGPRGGWRFGNWDDRSGLHPGYDRFYSDRAQRRGGGYDRGWGGRGPAWGGGERFTGMEGNRHRGVYGGDYRVGRPDLGDHGGYRGEGWNRGGGMNPGRGRGW